MAGFQQINSVPLPVGEYSLMPDQFYEFNFEDSLPDHLPQLFVELAQKLRIDLPVGHGISAFRVLKKNALLAMFPSRVLVGSLSANAARGEAREKVLAFVRDLRTAGVSAVPMHGEHHAILFYKDLQTQEPMTPAHLADLMRVRDGRLAGVIQKYNMQQWADAYVASAHLFTA